MILTGALLLSAALALPVLCQETPSDAPSVPSTFNSSTPADSTLEPGPALLNSEPPTDEREPTIDDIRHNRVSARVLRTHPMLYWRHWANKPLRVVPAFFFILFATIVAQELAPARISASRDCCRKQFWRSFWRGSLLGILMVSLARPLFKSEIGMPLGWMVIACLEFLLLAGLTISTTLIGERLMGWMPFMKEPRKHPLLCRVLVALAGTVFVALILAIPGLGRLPRLGTRLCMLLCVLGAGAFLKTRFGSEPLP